MRAILLLGKENQDRLEVFSSYWGGSEEVKFNDEIIYKKKRKIPIWFTQKIELELKGVENYRLSLDYNCLIMKSKLFIDGKLYKDCLFPQMIAYNALLIAILTLILS